MAHNVETVRAVEVRDSIMSVSDAKDLEFKQSLEHDYYAVYLKNEATDEIVRVRTPVWHLDLERRAVIVNGKPRARNAHEVALDVWAAHGADDHTLELVMRGSLVVATPTSIANELAMSQSAAAA